MNVLFLTLSNMENIYDRGIYSDLVRELAKRGINIHVVFPRERREMLPTELVTIDNITLLKVKTGNITKTDFIEKGISTLTIESQYLRAVKKYFSDIHFDLIMYSTPPITFERVVNYFKKKHQTKTYLMLKDIFPQNAVDIGLIKNGGVIWKYFRKKEKKLYEISDMIGCMTKGNVQYILNHNPNIDEQKLEIFPNSIEPIDSKTTKSTNYDLKDKYQIPHRANLFIYGGNLGKPQGPDFLLKVIENFYKVDNSFLLIVGSGTEYEKIKHFIETTHPKNVGLVQFLPKIEYDQLLKIADVGLIFLDRRFTIPNFPSRLTSYLEYSIPILAATDKHTDLKDILNQSKSGLWCESEDIDSFITLARKLANNEMLRKEMGENGRNYLEEHYDVRKTANTIIKHLK